MNKDLMFSSKTPEWSTPQELFDGLNAVYHFTLDAAATAENAKCKRFFTREQDGLSKNWGGAACSVIRLMAEESAHGSKRDIPRHKSRGHVWSCCCPPGQTRRGFMIFA